MDFAQAQAFLQEKGINTNKITAPTYQSEQEEEEIKPYFPAVQTEEIQPQKVFGISELTKQYVQHTQSLIQACEEGFADWLETFAEIKKANDALSEVLQISQGKAVQEAKNYHKDELNAKFNLTLVTRNTPKYCFSDSLKWKELNERVEKEKIQLKKFEELLVYSAKTEFEILDKETGELIPKISVEPNETIYLQKATR